mgnify:CR=1 FL=1
MKYRRCLPFFIPGGRFYLELAAVFSRTGGCFYLGPAAVFTLCTEVALLLCPSRMFYIGGTGVGRSRSNTVLTSKRSSRYVLEGLVSGKS